MSNALPNLKISLDNNKPMVYSLNMTSHELKKWRLNQGYSQVKLAELLSVTDQTVYRWETDRREIPSFLHLALECLERRGGEQGGTKKGYKGKGKRGDK